MGSVILCRVCWMERYQGVSDKDKAIGGGSFVKEHAFGHEVYNFKPFQGMLYGYVEAPSGGRIRIERLGAPPGSSSVNNAWVFWAATHPNRGGLRVVGWYENATVHREPVIPTGDLGEARRATDRDLGGKEVCTYNMETDERWGLCLPLQKRTMIWPTGERGAGQSNIWYPPDEKAGRLVAFAKGYR